MNNPRLRRFAPIGLYLALAAAVVSAGLYIVQHEFNLYLKISLGLILIGLAIFAILDPSGVRQGLTGRQARHGSNALVLILAFVGILVVANYLIYKYPKRWDLTADKSHTLASETIQALQTLPQNVTAEAFYTSRTPSETTRTLLNDFKYNSKGKFDYKFIDPEADPVAAQNARIQQDGTVVLQMGSHQELITSPSEDNLTSSLIRMTSPGPRTIYFLTGEGERDITASGQTGMSQAKTALEGKSYTVKPLNLISSPKIPDDATALVVAGPTKPLSQDEVKLISDYLNKGGGVVVMEEPTPVTDFGTSPDPLADYLASTWNIQLGNDFIIDRTVNPPTVAAANEYGSSPITDKIKTTVSLFPTARSVAIKDSSSSAKVAPVILASTASQSWGETNFTDLAASKANYDQGQDVAGPLSLAASAQMSDKNSRVVVIGDSDFATDNAFGQYANGDFFINSVDWAARQDKLINLTPKAQTQRLLLPPQAYIMNLILLGSVFVIPGAVVVSGLLVWLQRRRRG